MVTYQALPLHILHGFEGHHVQKLLAHRGDPGDKAISVQISLLSLLDKNLNRADKHDIILYYVSSISIYLLTFINPRHMCSKGYSTWSVILSVRLSVTTFSATTRNKAAKRQYQRVQCHTGLILNKAVCVLVLHSKVMA